MKTFASQTTWGGVIASISALCIGAATLTPASPPLSNALAETCRGWCGDTITADLIRNILLFVPFGFGLSLAGCRTRRALVIGASLSAVVELLQIQIISGRDASLLDWITNSLGTFSGALLASNLRRVLRPSRRASTGLAVIAFLLWVGALVFGALAIEPLPSAYPYWAQRAPHLGDFEDLSGELISAQVNGVELDAGRMPNGDSVRFLLRHGTVRLDAILRPGSSPLPTRVAPIARIADSVRQEILLLGQRRDELVFRVRLRASAMHLETPGFALAHAFGHGTGDAAHARGGPETVSATLDRGRLRLSAQLEDSSLSREFELGPADAWSFFVPWDFWFGPRSRLVSEIWVAALLLPAAYWTAMITSAQDARWRMAGMAVLAAVILTIVPRVFHMPPTKPWDYLSCALGVAIAWLLAAAVAGRGVGRKRSERRAEIGIEAQ